MARSQSQGKTLDKNAKGAAVVDDKGKGKGAAKDDGKSRDRGQSASSNKKGAGKGLQSQPSQKDLGASPDKNKKGAAGAASKAAEETKNQKGVVGKG